MEGKTTMYKLDRSLAQTVYDIEDRVELRETGGILVPKLRNRSMPLLRKSQSLLLAKQMRKVSGENLMLLPFQKSLEYFESSEPFRRFLTCYLHNDEDISIRGYVMHRMGAEENNGNVMIFGDVVDTDVSKGVTNALIQANLVKPSKIRVWDDAIRYGTDGTASVKSGTENGGHFYVYAGNTWGSLALSAFVKAERCLRRRKV